MMLVDAAKVTQKVTKNPVYRSDGASFLVCS